MTREIREILIGGVTVLALGAVLVWMNAHAHTAASTSSQMVVHAKFNKVDGLSEGAEVRMGGIAIGKVVGMTLDQQLSLIHI